MHTTKKLAVLCLLFLPAQARAQIVVTETARSIRPGELVLLTIRTPEPVDAVQVRAFDREWPAFADDPRTWGVLIGVDLEVKPGVYHVSIAAAGERAASSLNVAPYKFPTRKLTVDPAFVTPPPEVVPRIEREARELALVWESSSHTRLWDGPFVPPVPDPANSAFGTRSVFNGQPRAPHSGADFLSGAGTPVKAPGGGRIVLARSRYYTGGTVVIDHGLGLFSLMAHLSAIDVQTGDVVKAGDVVGKVGATGRVTGPHLHWAVRANGAHVDPLSLLFVTGPHRLH
jgi:murein DD-endopeptidase MepM/ murein hydrolase activator NlpD